MKGSVFSPYPADRVHIVTNGQPVLLIQARRFLPIVASLLLLSAAARSQSQQSLSYSQQSFAEPRTRNLAGGQPSLAGPFGQTTTLSLSQGLFDESLLERFNAYRQNSMRTDVELLFKLTDELHSDLGNPGNALHPDADLEKIEEIRKLAHKVKESMRTVP